MKPTIHGTRELGSYTVTDGAGITLFTIRTERSGRPRIFWDNPDTGVGGEGMHLTAAVIAGLMSTGLSYAEANRMGQDAVRAFVVPRIRARIGR